MEDTIHALTANHPTNMSYGKDVSDEAFRHCATALRPRMATTCDGAFYVMYVLNIYIKRYNVGRSGRASNDHHCGCILRRNGQRRGAYMAMDESHATIVPGLSGQPAQSCSEGCGVITILRRWCRARARVSFISSAPVD